MKKRRSKSKSQQSAQSKPVQKGENTEAAESNSLISSLREPRQKYQLNFGHYFLFFLIIVSMYFSYKLFQPYLNSIILATILAILVSPIHRTFETWFGGRKNLAALLTCTLITLLVLLPLAFMMVAFIQQGIDAFNAIADWIAAEQYKTLLDHPWVTKVTGFGEKYVPDVQRIFPDFKLKNIQIDQILLQTSRTVGSGLANQGVQIVTNITAVFGKFFLMLFALFFIVRDQDKMFRAILHLIPLPSSQERQLLDKVGSVAKSALLGTFATAIAQGIAGGIAFSIAQLPGLFWGTMMAFASLIPVVGTLLIWLPASIYLLLSGHWGYSLFMVLWCSIIVGSIDNFVRPLVMKDAGGNTSTLIIFFSIMGGLNLFGLIGLLYGPLIIGLMMVLLYIYSLEFRAFLNHQDRN